MERTILVVLVVAAVMWGTSRITAKNPRRKEMKRAGYIVMIAYGAAVLLLLALLLVVAYTFS